MELRNITLPALLRETASRFADRRAVEFHGDFYTWSEIDALSEVLADDFAYRGITKGDHVGIWSPNSLTWVLSFFAAAKLGATSVLINSNFTIRELRDAIRIAKVDWLLYGHCPRMDVVPDLIEHVQRDCPQLKGRMLDIRFEHADLLRLMFRNSKTVWDFHTSEGADTDDICCMIFTSGSTRSPKCAMLTHHAIVNNSASMAEVMGITQDDELCMSLPLFHMYGLAGCFLACVQSGALVHFMEGLRSIDIMKCIHRHRCTVFNGVPTSYLALISNKNISKYDLSSIRLGVLGGAPLTKHHLRRIQSAFPKTQFMANYGQTEGACLTNTLYGDSFEDIATTVGPPGPHIEMAIMDTETRELLPPDTQGEIVVRGYCIMRDYFNPDPEVLCPIDADGWLHTQDLGLLRPDGYLRIVGRIKDIIIRAGEDITPSEVEEAVMAYDRISDARVLGAPHDILGEQVVACVVLKESGRYKESELREILGQRLAPFKQPSHILVFSRFPASASGKINPRLLREEMTAKLDALSDKK